MLPQRHQAALLEDCTSKLYLIKKEKYYIYTMTMEDDKDKIKGNYDGKAQTLANAKHER